MGALLIEIQDGILVTPVPRYTAEEVENQTALSGWFSACALASRSSVIMHTVMLVADDGYVIRKEVFHHGGTVAAEE